MQVADENGGANSDETTMDNSTGTSTKPQTTPNESADISTFAARVQVPQLHGYSINNIESWFTRLEAFFRVHGFGKMNQDQRDQGKFNIAVMYMDERLYEQAFEIVRTPPAQDRYGTLRRTIINKFSASPMARLEQLTTGIQLGDNKSSHMLTQLQHTDVTRDQQLIKDFWIQRLPVSARAVIAGVAKGNPEMTLEQLASIADEIIDAVRVNSVESVSTKPLNPLQQQQKQSIEAITTIPPTSLETRVGYLERTLARIESKICQERQTRSRERRSRSATPHKRPTSTAGDSTCWYHKRYGVDAKRCNTPCNFNSGSKN